MRNNSKKIKNTKLYIIGAGPSNKGLLTIKAVEILRIADIIYYDNLIDRKILDLAKSDAIKIPVGKSGEINTISQNEINNILVEEANKEKIIVRLKGGDPFIFGRGGEEALALSENNIPYEVIPGVSSIIAAADYAGIPLTCRDVSSGFSVVTAHDKDNDIDTNLNWDSLVKAGHTLVFVMCLKNLDKIKTNLIANGMGKETPAALVSSGTTPNQKVYITVLDNIDNIPEEYRVSPALLIVGDVVRLHDKLNWYNPMPQHKILILKDLDNDNEHLITRMGVENIQLDYLPTLSISKNDDYSDLINAIKNNNIDWLIINSGNAIKYLVTGLESAGMDLRVLYNAKIAVIGKSTQEVLLSYGLKPDFMPSKKFTGKGLAIELAEKYELKGKNILIPSGNLSNNAQQEILEKAGASVYRPIAYNNRPIPLNPESKIIMQKIHNGYYDSIAFLSPSGGIFLSDYLAQLDLTLPAKAILFAIGETTKSKLRELWGNEIITPSLYTLEGLCDTIIDYTRRVYGGND